MGSTGMGTDGMSRLQGILRWSVEQQGQDGTTASEMSAERREFLQAALAELQGAPSDADVMKSTLLFLEGAVKTIGESSDSDAGIEEVAEKAVQAFESLSDFCETIDNANDMIPIGGFPIVEQAVDCKDSAVQAQALNLCGVVSQNNPRCQEYILNSSGLLPKYLHLLKHGPVAGVRIKALFATACLVKDFDAAQVAFARANGYQLLGGCLSSGVEQLVAKAAFLTANLIRHSPANGDFVLEHGLLAELLQLLSKDRTVSLEFAADTVCLLVEQHAGCKALCESSKASLHPALRRHVALLLRKMHSASQAQDDDSENYEDEIRCLTTLANALA